MLAELSEDSENGRLRRKAFQTAIEGTIYEYQGLGIEMNQRYTSDGVFQSDQGDAPKLTEDPILYYQPTTYPGARVPHAWARLRGVEESGCVLVRPDRFVAWRSNLVQKDCEDTLLKVLRSILACH
jgi:hypothetical protein